MHSKKLLSLLTTLICLVSAINAFGQNVTVRGTVKDAQGPVVGAVVLSGGANAVTDVNGNYSITVPSNAVLEVSCLGYATQNVNVNGRTVIDIVLSEDAELLQEAVALGYGAQTKKKDLSASVGIVSNPEHNLEVGGKAGRSRHLGRRPRNRGVVMNPVDHPMGGGEGRQTGGHPRSRKGIPAKGYKTRAPKKQSSKYIVERRKK